MENILIFLLSKTLKTYKMPVLLVYNLERDNILKFSQGLNAKSLYPTNIERQKVSLALKIFHSENLDQSISV